VADEDLEPNVFGRTRRDGPELSMATYNIVIGLVLSWGFFINWLIVRYIDASLLLVGLNYSLFIAGYIASCIYGVHLFNTSKDPSMSFIGYNFVVIPFGLVLSMVLGRSQPGLVLQAVQVTAGVTILMMIVGTVRPEWFQTVPGSLTIALLAAILVELTYGAVFHHVPEWIEWVVAIGFCSYIGYDWGRALRIPRTVDNAVDSAAAIYMDVLNLFLRILRVLGRRR